jgi:MoaA/NifB/PqqE/SkfB family radical SAM enzyme
MKVLMWREHLEACAKGDYLPPVNVDTDPSNRCQFSCLWCNAYDMIHGESEMKDLPEEHLLKLADFYKDWGVLSSCVAGGGEPLMNNGTMAFLERMHNNGLENGLITNGVLLDDEKIDIVAKTCRWVGFSMDAAKSNTYLKVKGIKNEKLFNKVVENIKKLTKKINDLGIKNDVCYKFLLHPYNANEIYDAVKLAKECGVKDFQLRPVGWINLTKTKGKQIDFTGLYEKIDKQIEKALELETDDFHVYGIRHKFNPNLKPKKNFKKCWTIPMLPTFGADGNVHTCFDMRGRKDLIMCSHYPDPTEILKFWNSEEHHKIIDNIDINKCPRCTWTTYNEAVEKVIIEDRMCYKFP